MELPAIAIEFTHSMRKKILSYEQWILQDCVNSAEAKVNNVEAPLHRYIYIYV